jgi:hypothetical protein
MLVLDENLPAEQRLLLRKWRIHFHAVGKEIAFSGTKDENLIPFLHRLSYPTFFSLDRDFYPIVQKYRPRLNRLTPAERQKLRNRAMQLAFGHDFESASAPRR